MVAGQMAWNGINMLKNYFLYEGGGARRGGHPMCRGGGGSKLRKLVIVRGN